jgi:hypothetical protein
MNYPPKRAWWVTGLVVFAGVSEIVLGVLMMISPAVGPVPSVVEMIVVGLVLTALGVFMLWMFSATAYEIAPPDLRIRFGPLRRTIPLAAIVEVVPTQSLLVGGPEWSFIWSTDRLRVRYRKKNGKLGWPVAIAPRDKFAFLLELAEAVPALEAGPDGALRLPGAAPGKGTSRGGRSK